MNQSIGQPELLKETNRSRLFDIFRRKRLVSRPDLTEITGLSRATIAILVDELLKLKLVQEVGFGDSRGGRPPVLLEFNPEAAYVIGAGMHDLEWSVVITDLDARVVDRETATIRDAGPDAAIEALVSAVGRIIGRAVGMRLLPGIGIGSPGLVDTRTGVVKSAVDIGWIDVPMADLVGKALKLNASVANRSKVGALAEFRYASQRGVQDLIYIAIGTGVAAGIIHQGELYIGTNSSAGELGHITIVPDGPQCACGNRGCLQELVSERAIANRARRYLKEHPGGLLAVETGLHPERLTADEVLLAAERGDETAVHVIRETAYYLAIAVGNLINLFNPEMIVLGGPVSQRSTVLVEEVKREVTRRAMAYPLSAVEIVRSSLGMEAGAVGAASLVLQEADKLVFASPVHSQR